MKRVEEVPDNMVVEEVVVSQTFEDVHDYATKKSDECSTLAEKELKRAREKRLKAIQKIKPKPQTLDEFFQGNKSANSVAETVPRTLNVMNLIKARSEEIKMCEQALSSGPQKTAVFQRIPNWMRRRAMSHNPKRVPKFARKAFEASVTSKAAHVKKHKYKKHRKSKLPKVLMFTNRQQKYRWLESHVWHAKRFQMVERWGFKLANVCNDKILRALHREVSYTKAAMCDTSYYGWIELRGTQKELLASLSRMTSQDVGLTFAANDFITGWKEGQTLIYKTGCYPFGCIGPVSFVWKVVESDSEAVLNNKYSSELERILWINFHPAMKFPFLSALKTAIKGSQVSFTNLERSLTSLEITGPKALKIMQHCLQYASVRLKYEEKFDLNKSKTKVIKMKKSFWWTKMYSSETDRQQVEDEAERWPKIQSKDVPAGRIFGFLSRDPRLAFRFGSSIESQSESSEGNKEFLLPKSFIFDSDVRDYIMTRKMTNNAVKNYLGNHLPMTPIDSFDEEARVPILIIKKYLAPASCDEMMSYDDNKYRDVWKLVMPRNWFMPFWLLFKRMRLHVFGLRERERFLKRAGYLCFPQELPDSNVGRLNLKQTCTELNRNLKRKPPSKRFHFERFGVENPFECDFESLFKKSEEPFLDKISDLLKDNTALNPVIKPAKVGNHSAVDRREGAEKVEVIKHESQGQCHPNQPPSAKKAKMDLEDPEVKVD